MALHVVNHPIAEHVLTDLRKRKTTAAEYRSLCRRIGAILLVKAFENLELKSVTVGTPLGDCEGKVLVSNVVLVPILRAGLALLSPALELLPEAMVGYFGLQRSEEAMQIECYYQKLPPMAGADVFILDPMLASGCSAQFAIQRLQDLHPKSISFVSILAAPEGIRRLMDEFPTVNIFTVAVDKELDGRNFIIPGLGDFGDRFHGTL
ncbi:MAG: uracil phosphoribosyltransferase [Puniceicoccales bacterium]|jgi:uracil phosphoribosyltransferase|nr:uracil phosphoribosyltransferase [Puniceicoccales bacterium]